MCVSGCLARSLSLSLSPYPRENAERSMAEVATCANTSAVHVFALPAPVEGSRVQACTVQCVCARTNISLFSVCARARGGYCSVCVCAHVSVFNAFEKCISNAFKIPCTCGP